MADLTMCKECRRLGGSHFIGCKKIKPLFTTKHYKAIGKTLNKNYQEIQNYYAENHVSLADYYMFNLQCIVKDFMETFGTDNPKFDWQKFKKEVYKS